MYPYVPAVLSTIAKVWKKPKCPSVDKWIKLIKTAVVYLHNNVLLGCKKEDFTFDDRMDGPGELSIMLSEICQSEKDKYHRISPIRGLSNEQTELISKIETNA